MHLINWYLGCLICVASVFSGDRVKLSDIDTLTLHHDRYTNARRTSAVPQLECVGGNCGEKYKPKVVQCYNRGSDGSNIQWECKASLPNKCRFGKLKVGCEGYDNSYDKYVLAGSCGLQYTLECEGSNNYQSATDSSNGNFGLVIVIIFVMIFVIYFFCIKPNDDDNRRRPPHGPDGHDFRPGGPPPPPGFKHGSDPSAPPPYDSSTGPNQPPPPYADHQPSYGFGQPQQQQYYSSSSQQYHQQQPPQNQQDGPGFWSGTVFGALGGYMLGSSTSSRRRHHSPNYSNSWFGSTSRSGYGCGHREYSSSPPRQRRSSDDRGGFSTQSGFATTSNR